jgi:putative transposase
VSAGNEKTAGELPYSPGGAAEMSHTFSRNHVHVVFSTKDRRKIIPNDLQAKLWAYLGGIARKHETIALAINGTDNHAHLLLNLPPTIALAKVILLLKSNSSRWMSDHREGFSWQEGYGAFSVSSSNLDQVTRYIQNQEAHHRKIGFEEEFRAILLKHHVEFDPKYIFG